MKIYLVEDVIASFCVDMVDVVDKNLEAKEDRPQLKQEMNLTKHSDFLRALFVLSLKAKERKMKRPCKELTST